MRAHSPAAGRRCRGDGGSVIVEAALVMPLFLTFIMAAIDYGVYRLINSQMTNAVRDGSRAGIVYYCVMVSGSCSSTSGSGANTPLNATQPYTYAGTAYGGVLPGGLTQSPSQKIVSAVKGRLAGQRYTTIRIRCYVDQAAATAGTATNCNNSAIVAGTSLLEVQLVWTFSPMTFAGRTFIGTPSITTYDRMVVVGQPS